MQDEDIYRNMSVLRSGDGHILIHDSSYPPDNPPNHYFDLHGAVLFNGDQEYITNSYSEVTGEEKGKACEIYLRWKFMEDSNYVKRQAKKIFPVPAPSSDRTIYLRAFEPVKEIQQKTKLKTASKEQKIRQACNERKIKQLCHFTHISNLTSILRTGLVGRDKINKEPKFSQVKVNDEDRFDGCLNAVCLSISFPNYQMFHKYKKYTPTEWVVISLKPEILFELDCAFCKENAASKNVTKKSLAQRKKFDAFEAMFKDFNNTYRKDLNIPDWFTTNPQAEVLVFDPIPTSFFKEIYFYNYKARNTWVKENSAKKENFYFFNEDFFSARCDYKFW